MKNLTCMYIILLFVILGAGLIIAGILLNNLPYVLLGHMLPMIIATVSLILFNEN